MKKQNMIFRVLGVLLIMLTLSSSAAKEMQPNDVINFPDKNFEKAVREKIDKPKGGILYSEVSEVKEIEFSNKSIKSIKGIQHFKSLYLLDLSSNKIVDISVITNLKKIIQLSLNSNNITDYSAIYSLPKLSAISFNKGDFVDVKNYSKLKNIVFLISWENSKGDRETREIKLDKIKLLGKVTLDEEFINKYAY